jgi:hypothetical protein
VIYLKRYQYSLLKQIGKTVITKSDGLLNFGKGFRQCGFVICGPYQERKGFAAF